MPERSALRWLCLLALVCVCASRETRLLERPWKFSFQREVTERVEREIPLPHTFTHDAESGDQNYYRGPGVYKFNLVVSGASKNGSVWLRFLGASQSSFVYLNDELVGTHRGAYTAFVVDLTRSIRFDQSNALEVRVTNAFDAEIMPLDGDFNVFGGLYRRVELVTAAYPHVSPLDSGSSGVWFQPKAVSAASASFEVLVRVRGVSGQRFASECTLEDASGASVWSSVQKGDLPSSGLQDARFTGSLANPHLWNGTFDPYLYVLRVRVGVPTSESSYEWRDEQRERVGLRFSRVEKASGFYLNGFRYPLRGASRHQERASVASALSRADHREDMSLLLEMGANVLRLSHYPQDPYFLELADESGMVVWSEIPFIGGDGYTHSSGFEANGRVQLTELIRQQRNHASVFFWGLFNELTHVSTSLVTYLRSLNELAHAEDPTRLTVAATNMDNQELINVPDLIGFNVYKGWYNGKPEDVGAWADSHQASVSRPVAISEYGGGGSIRQQQEALVASTPASTWHPENYQLDLHERYYAEASKRPFLWALFIWNMFDFSAANRREGEVSGLNDKGMVTYDRHTRKDAFYFYKAQWNTRDAFVHVAGRRLEQRFSAQQSFRVFSNQRSVELLLTGVSQGSRESASGKFVWSSLPTVVGRNEVEARSGALRDSYRFRRDWSARGPPRPRLSIVRVGPRRGPPRRVGPRERGLCRVVSSKT